MIIGITGGVGSGKSTVLDILENDYLAKVIKADDVARDLLMPGGASYHEVLKLFGEGILQPGSDLIDRAKVAEIVFNDPGKLKQLNGLTHPLVKIEIMRRINEFYNEDPQAIIVVEAALMIEAGYTNILDELWVVIAEEEARFERLKESRGYSYEKVREIMSNQLSREEFLNHADYVIENSGDMEETRRQIDERIKFLLVAGAYDM